MYVCTLGDQRQILLCGDLQDPETLAWYRAHLPDRVRLVYSDPPWNPGNATYWRTHAGRERCESYTAFLRAWCSVVVECMARGAEDVLVEQASNPKHHNMLLDVAGALPGWALPEVGRHAVLYGSGSRLLPNLLLHFGRRALAADPAGLHGEPMTRRVFDGLDLAPGAWVCDPCMGLGMTSRMAHHFGLNAIGSELNPKRLERTVGWLIRRGYTVTS